MSDDETNVDDLASKLALLKPASRLDRDRVLYLAGRASAVSDFGGRTAANWRMTTMIASLSCALLVANQWRERARHSAELIALRSVAESTANIEQPTQALQDSVAAMAEAAANPPLQMQAFVAMGEPMLDDMKGARSLRLRSNLAARSRNDLMLELLPQAVLREHLSRGGWSLF